LLNRIVLPISLAWLVGSSVYQRNIFTTILTAPPLLFVGTISYSLYLWQQMFLARHELYLTIFLLWPLMFVLAWLSRRFIETPSIGLGRRLMVERKLAPLG
jgi:peptidoglycan/LPS O-acetylase OafA/YrhL